MGTQTALFRYARAAIALALIAAFIAGCGSPQQPAAPIARDAADPGYASLAHHAVNATRETWSVGNEYVDVALLAPVEAGAFPVLVYLPGLGESADTGRIWREAWAEAGYMVIALQASASGPAVWSLPQARAGDFTAVAKQQFSPAGLRARMEWLNAAWAEIRKRHDAKQPPYDRMDLTRGAVLAGYDLGAQSAMAAAGAALSGASSPHPAIEARAVIALSPYADASGQEQGHAGIRVPVLWITGSGDVDQYGLVKSASLRHAPFAFLPPGQKYLLTLEAITHGQLAGNPATASVSTPTREERPAQESKARDGKPRGSAGPNPRKELPTAVEDEPKPLLFRAQRLGLGSEPALSPARGAAIQSFSTAFLDANVKNDAAARAWLAQDASRWLRGVAELSVRN